MTQEDRFLAKHKNISFGRTLFLQILSGGVLIHSYYDKCLLKNDTVLSQQHTTF